MVFCTQTMCKVHQSAQEVVLMDASVSVRIACKMLDPQLASTSFCYDLSYAQIS